VTQRFVCVIPSGVEESLIVRLVYLMRDLSTSLEMTTP
jgi:hypothetical protein